MKNRLCILMIFICTIGFSVIPIRIIPLSLPNQYMIQFDSEISLSDFTLTDPVGKQIEYNNIMTSPVDKTLLSIDFGVSPNDSIIMQIDTTKYLILFHKNEIFL